MGDSYYIACVERTRCSDLVVWWRPNGRGYTTDLNRAGKYSAEETQKICRPMGGGSVHVAFQVGKAIAGEMAVVDRDSSDFFKLRQAANIAACKEEGKGDG